MKVIAAVFLVIFLAFVYAPPAISADDKAPEVKKADGPVKFNPPMLGKPGKRVGGGTRGVDTTGLKLVALVPDYAGTTSVAQPSFCWYISRPTDIMIEIVLDDGKSVKPVYEKKLNKPPKEGIYCSSLSGSGVSLQPAMEYQWFVAIVPDPEQRSKDIVSGGSVIFTPAQPGLSKEFSATGGMDLIRKYAANGYWYDAIEKAVSLSQRDPGNEALRRARSELLGQVGLPDL